MPTITRNEFTHARLSSIDGTRQALKTETVETRHAGIQRDLWADGARLRVISLSAQVFDAYGYQRELTIEQRRDPGAPMGDRRHVHWTVSAYKHPFKPPTKTRVSRDVALRLMDRIWRQVTEHPILLLNETGEGVLNGQHDGFVRFHERLLAGARPSVDLL